MTDFAADHDMRAALTGRARPRIVWGGVDPGSVRIGVAAATGEPGALVLAMTPTVVEVGHKIEYDPPLVKRRKDGTEYLVHSAQVNGDVEVDAACAIVLAHLIRAGVTHLAIEHVENPFSKSMRQTRALMVADRVATILRLAAAREGIHVVMVTVSTWRARLRPLLRAIAPDESPGQGDAVRGAGVELGRLLRLQITQWPMGGDHDTADTRDAGGLLLWQALPPLERRAKRAPGERGRRKPAPRAPGEVSPQAKWQRARTAEARVIREAAKLAAGCHCGPHRHCKGCPLYVRMYYPSR